MFCKDLGASFTLVLSIFPTSLYFHEQVGLETGDSLPLHTTGYSFKAYNVLSVTETMRGAECH